jgi:hypothetical protein
LYNDDTCYRWVIVMNDTIHQITIEENPQSAIKFTEDVRSRDHLHDSTSHVEHTTIDAIISHAN